MTAHLLVGEVAAPAPFLGAGLLGIITLGVFLTYLVALGLHEGWDHTIGYGLRWIASHIQDVSIDVGIYTISPFGFIADVFLSVDHQISHALAVAALNTEKAATSMWSLTAEVFWWSVRETKALSLETFHALEHVFTVTIPDAAKWAYRESTAGAARLVHGAEAAARAAEAELFHLAHAAAAVARHGLRTAEHALGWSESEVGALRRDLGGLTARVDRIARQLTPAAVVALIGATIFKDFGLGWLRCNNVGRMGRALCGLPLGLLDDLLALAIVPLIATDICDFADAVESLALDFQGALFALVDVEDALVGCHGATAPPVLSLPPLHFPPTNLGLALAG